MDLFFHFGPPNKVITDQGREFVNELNESLFSKFKVKHLITSAYHQQTNGQDELTNRTIKTALAKLVNQDKNNWDDFINPVLFAIRTSQQASTKVSPYMAMFGRKPKLVCEIKSDEKCKQAAEMEQNDVEEKTTTKL